MATHCDDRDRFIIEVHSAKGFDNLLTGVAGSAVATLATALGFAEAGATHFGCLHVGKGCTKPSECCSSRCKHKRCRAHRVGQCTAENDVCVTDQPLCGGAPASAGGPPGANFCSDGGGDCMACSTDAECATALNTPGSACVDASSGICNCTGSGTACAKPCTA